tara:strand:- start:1288 stop:1503 length:216 start_codon:yes stop_codon:yes gene_type:complete
MNNENKTILELVRNLEEQFLTMKRHYKTLLSQYASLIKKYNISEEEQLEDLKERYEEFIETKLELKTISKD